ncbi:MAG TPA: exodeoxyribonuclease VII large subunit [Pyrinomonadaceae bacterium]|nr:exodeoxyribonuclease VII large subunit [Pyrinomonadaceae bacterium]
MANQPLFNALFDETERKPLTVSQLTNSIRIALESRFASVWVEGEISNFKAHSSGHWYFTLKDQNAQLRAKCFRSTNTRIRFRPTDGLHVRARGKLSIYAPRGEYELVVDALDPVGAGALRIAFEQLRDRLNAEGLFAKELKRPLPVLPRRVGIVTSPTGAAIRDILNVISRRTRTVHVLFSPARVQGDMAGPDIARAIRFINQYHERALAEGRVDDLVDVLIVGRGGGSTEDLWAFNQEEVARAIRKSVIPVISAVGHETDFTIADFVADFRAPTPSAAAEIVAAREDQICSALDNLGRQLVRLTRFQVVNLRARVQEQALSHAFDEVKSRLTRARRRYEAASSACDVAMDEKLQRGRERLALAAASLDALSPLGVLQRGYAIAQDASGKLVRDAASVSAGDEVSVRLARGKLNTRVVTTEQEQ